MIFVLTGCTFTSCCRVPLKVGPDSFLAVGVWLGHWHQNPTPTDQCLYSGCVYFQKEEKRKRVRSKNQRKLRVESSSFYTFACRMAGTFNKHYSAKFMALGLTITYKKAKRAEAVRNQSIKM